MPLHPIDYVHVLVLVDHSSEACFESFVDLQYKSLEAVFGLVHSFSLLRKKQMDTARSVYKRPFGISADFEMTGGPDYLDNVL